MKTQNRKSLSPFIIGGILTAVLFSSSAAAGLTYKEVKIPGALGVIASGINNDGRIVGSYRDTSGVRGFALYGDGSYINLNVPTSNLYDGFYAEGINNVNQIIGNAQGTYDPSIYYPFLYDGSSYAPLTMPADAVSSSVAGINDNGQMVGNYRDSLSFSHGFTYFQGVSSEFSVPGSFYSIPTSINNNGDIAGYYYDATGIERGFLYRSGIYTKLSAPKVKEIYPEGINNLGHVVGFLIRTNGAYAGFVYRDGVLTILDGGKFGIISSAKAINDAGNIVGEYYLKSDPAGKSRSYLAAP